MARKVIDEPSEEIVASAKTDRAAKRGPFPKLVVFLKQVLAEMRKVVTPTRKELLNYTAVVLVFVIIMMAIVYGFDFVFSWFVVWLLGAPGSSPG